MKKIWIPIAVVLSIPFIMAIKPDHKFDTYWSRVVMMFIICISTVFMTLVNPKEGFHLIKSLFTEE
jgi:multidrug transporter EmrE-like cation transporter